MPLRVVRYQQTPNPHALKCVVNERIAEKSRSFRTPADATGDQLATRVFAVPGVVGVFLCEDWLTVTKSPNADWDALKPALEQALAAG